MRTRLARLPVLVTAALGLMILAGCSDQPAAAPAARTSTPTPTLGGPPPHRQPVPTAAMDRLEKPVHARLAAQIARQGLTLEYLDCPHWDGAVPSRMTCRGYVDGLVARVDVHLKAAVEGKAVSFDARLLNGVIATRKLEDTLRRQGWTEVDCGAVPAYPARVGSRIVCRVKRSSELHYVVATVSDRSGAVMITDYRGGRSSS